MNSLSSLSSKQLRKAANLQDKIQSLQKELAQLLGSTTKTPVSPGTEGRSGK